MHKILKCCHIITPINVYFISSAMKWISTWFLFLHIVQMLCLFIIIYSSFVFLSITSIEITSKWLMPIQVASMAEQWAQTVMATMAPRSLISCGSHVAIRRRSTNSNPGSTDRRSLICKIAISETHNQANKYKTAIYFKLTGNTTFQQSAPNAIDLPCTLILHSPGC